ncbi:MAG: carboxypeptidase regulatory-like domain-containing protein [Blastocatellia bacterium]|nr:carboxypeptidase regulatory-like domain-containing protein [Blastocatellia bacterium]
MKIRNLIPAFAGFALIALASVSAFAQVARIEGSVTKADTKEPIVGAVVQIVRTDIKGNYDVKTDKKGNFLHAGIPLTGTYTIIVSAPGCQPSYFAGIKPGGDPIKFDLNPGDGSKLTIDDIKRAQSGTPATGGASAAGGSGNQKQPTANQKQPTAAEIKKAQEEYEKKKAENDKLKAEHENMKKLFDQGRQLAQNKDYSGAVNAFNEAAKLDAEQQAIWANLSLALFNRGATQLNANQRDAAKQDFVDSINAASKAIDLLDAQSKDPAKGNDPNLKKNKIDYLNLRIKPASVLAERYNDSAQFDVCVKDYQTIVDLTDDAVLKNATKAKIAQGYFQFGKVAESTAIYQDILKADPNNLDALYGLGLNYTIDETKKQEVVELWKRFMEKAPSTDSRVAAVEEGIKSLGIPLSSVEKSGGKGGKKKP